MAFFGLDQLEALVRDYYMPLLRDRVGRPLDWERDVRPLLCRVDVMSLVNARTTKEAFQETMRGLIDGLVEELRRGEP